MGVETLVDISIEMEKQVIIDGKKIALKQEEELKKQVQELSNPPKVISILVGEDPSSVLYTNLKQKKAEDVGINFEALKFSENSAFDEVGKVVDKLNNDPEVNGIMVQLPLPKSFLGVHKTEELLEKINPEKDVDGLREESLYLPATARGIFTLLEEENVPVERKTVVVVGSTGMVGKPLVKEMRNRGANVLEADVNTSDLKSMTEKADILISATGVPGIIKGDMVKMGVVVIDVGTTKVEGKLKGDVDFDSVYPKASKITPVPGGVGPMTVISLMENVVESVVERNN
ncbi:MAG: bifunctional 5,10-methylenetetrahydrofolate dehydrogenase/5,10-methenyltetrahydrofolate cyclohydrolase [Candidatus Daviesbacteria bacterium]